jgi:hypothetical protein
MTVAGTCAAVRSGCGDVFDRDPVGIGGRVGVNGRGERAMQRPWPDRADAVPVEQRPVARGQPVEVRGAVDIRGDRADGVNQVRQEPLGVLVGDGRGAVIDRQAEAVAGRRISSAA